jgi:NADH dehydrogenase
MLCKKVNKKEVVVMKKIVIIGGGFAGLWAAFSAMRLIKLEGLEQKVTITLISKDPYHGLRPRYYESDLEATRISLAALLKPLDINLVIGDVAAIHSASQQVLLKTEISYPYDKLILATGSGLHLPVIPGLKEYAFNVDTYADAKKLQDHIAALSLEKVEGQYTVVVIGGSFTGIEIATELRDRLNNLKTEGKGRVIVIDRSKLASRFSPEVQAVVNSAFKDMAIETISGVEAAIIAKDHIVLNTGDIIKTQTVVWAGGMKSSALTMQFELELDSLGRLPVDRFLRVQGVDNCFAAGDVAAATTDGVHSALLSCQHAMPQGRFAGNNAVAELFDKELLMYEQPKYVTSLDLGSWGALYAEGWEQRVVKTKEAAKAIKLFINHERIYPPFADKDMKLFLEAAEPMFKAIKTTE